MFTEHLDSIISKVEGTLGVVVMGLDGIPIEKRLLDPSLNLDALAAEYTSVLKVSSSITQEADQGPLEEFVVFTDSKIVAMRMITHEYFLLMLLDRDGNVGRARFELRKAKHALAKEFVV